MKTDLTYKSLVNQLLLI